MGRANLPSTPCRISELRRELVAILREDEELDAFCLDRFPATYLQFTRGMTRTQKLNRNRPPHPIFQDPG